MQLYTEGDDLYDAMLKAIDSATRIIRMESYILASDHTGWTFANALIRKAQQGITVKVILDAAGSLFYTSNELYDALKNNEVELRLFHRWSFRHPFRYNRRNHRKLLIIDDKLVFLGGFNIHDENSKKYYGEERWRDTHIVFSNDLVLEAVSLFNEAWSGFITQSRRKLSALPNKEVMLISRHLRTLNHALWSLARQYIYLTTPFFAPDKKTQLALINAAHRGVDVRVLVPSKGTIRIAQWAARATYARLLHSGVKIYEYTPRMLHAKTFIMDDYWGSVGTANLDYRSFFLNYELNLVTHNPAICQQLKDDFLNDLASSIEVCKVAWPNRAWSDKLTEFIGWMARRWL